MNLGGPASQPNTPPRQQTQNPNDPHRRQRSSTGSAGDSPRNSPQNSPQTPAFPIGRAYLCITSFTPLPHQTTAITLRPGDEGKITRSHIIENRQWYHVTVPRRNIRGFVPDWAVNVGTGIYGRTRVQVEQIQHIDGWGGTPRGHSVLESTFRGLMMGFKDKQAVVDFIRRDAMDLLNNDALANSTVDQILQGVRNAGFFAVLNQPNFTFTQLQSTGSIVDGSDTRLGLYLLFYSQFRGEPTRKPHAYVGKTQSGFGLRNNRHSTSQWVEMSSNHYQVARKAERRHMSPVCILTGEQPLPYTFAEQFFILMLQLYLPWVLRHVPEDFTEMQTADESRDNIAKYFSVRQQTHILTTVAREIFRITGWPGGCERPSFGSDWGLNWSSPFTESVKEKLIWTKISAPGEMAVYRRPPIQVTKLPDTNTVFITGSSERAVAGSDNTDRSSFSLTLHPDSEPNAGTWVYPAVEITLNGRRHPAAYARLPEVGPWDDWEEAMQVAIRLEWDAPDGGKVRRYIQAVVVDKFNQNADCAYSAYVNMIALKRFVTQQRVGEMYPWFRDWGVARVKEISWCHMQQLYIIRDFISNLPPARKARRRTLAEVGADLQARGAYGVNGPWQGFAPGPRPSLGETRRTKCDGCLISSWNVSL